MGISDSPRQLVNQLRRATACSSTHSFSICSSAAAVRRHGHAGPCCCRTSIECSAAAQAGALPVGGGYTGALAPWFMPAPIRCSPASQIRASRGERRVAFFGHEVAWISAIAGRFSAEAQRLYIRFRCAYKLYLSYTCLYIDKSPADHTRQRHIIAVYVRPILPIFGFGRCGRFQGPLESWFMGLWLC